MQMIRHRKINQGRFTADTGAEPDRRTGAESGTKSGTESKSEPRPESKSGSGSDIG